MEAKKFILVCGVIGSFVGCTTGNCRSQQVKAEQAGPELPVKDNKLIPESSSVDRVRVFKDNGSLQCGQGKSIDPATMAKELKDIRVYKTSMENDGKMRIQKCGAPTGNVNIFEIDKSNLNQALSYGFTEWIR